MNRHFSTAFMAVVALSTTTACARHDAQAADRSQDERPTVAAARIERGDIRQVLRVASAFRPFQEIEVHAKVAGYLKTITVDVGDRVKSGQLLAVLEVPELQDELKQDEAAIRRAQAEVRRAQADLTRTESAHEVAHLASTRLSGVMNTRPGLLAQQDIDEATGRDRIAEAQVTTAQAAVAASQQQLEIAQATLNRTQTLFDYTRVTAPFAGVVTHRYADTGAMIQAGTSSQTQALPLVRLSENSTLRLVIPVPESAVSRIRLGSTVDLEVQALGKIYRGTIARFADRLNSDTRTMSVEVDVENPSLELVPGMFANASLVLNEAKNVTLAPIQAVDRHEDSAQVMAIDRNGQTEIRVVTLGLEGAERVEVKTGLTEGDLVVTGNRGQLKPGAHVIPKLTASGATKEGGR